MLGFTTKKVLSSLLFWIISILSVLKLLNAEEFLLWVNTYFQVSYIDKFFTSSFWTYFVTYTPLFYVGWFLVTVVIFRGIPKLDYLFKFLNKKKPES